MSSVQEDAVNVTGNPNGCERGERRESVVSSRGGGKRVRKRARRVGIVVFLRCGSDEWALFELVIITIINL